VNITQETISDLNRIVHIEVEQADYEEGLQKTLKDYRKNASIKGFRKGKVPMSYIKNMIGQKAMADEINQLVNGKLNEYIKENEWNVLGQPLPVEDDMPQLDPHEMGNYVFKYEVGLAPELSLDDLKTSEPITKYNITVDEETLDKEMQNLRQQHGEVTHPTEDIQEDDVLNVQLEELDQEGHVKDEGITHETSIPVDMLKQGETKDKITAMKGDDENDEVVIEDLFSMMDKEKDEIAKNILGVDTENQNVEEISPRFRMKLNDIQRVEPAVLNQEFFDKLYGEGEVTSEDEFREKIRGEIEKSFESNADKQFANDMAKRMIEELEVSLPDDFLKRWIQKTNENPISEEQVEEEYESFRKNLKWYLIVDKVLREKELEVQEDEVREQMKQMVQAQFDPSGQYFDDQSLGQLADSIMQDDKQKNQIYEQLREQKAAKALQDILDLQEQEVTYNEFVEITQNQTQNESEPEG